MKTFRDAWKNRETVIIDGHSWEVSGINPTKTAVVLTRSIKVKAHFRRVGEYHGSGWRTISIRRPADAVI